MNLFKGDIDKKKVVELIRTILKGIGTDLEPFVALDIHPIAKARGFLLQDGHVRPREYSSLR